MIVSHRTDVRWLLLEWGAWRRANYHGPRRVRSWWGAGIMERFLPMVHVSSPDIIVDEARAWRTNQAIRQLGNEELRRVLLCQYVLYGDKQQKAQAAGMTVRTYFRRLRQARDLLGVAQQPKKNFHEPPCVMAPELENSV